MAVLGHLARLRGADIIQRLIHLGDDVETVEDVQRLWGLLLAAFAGLAVVLAAVGVYGVMSYSVS